MWKNLRLIKFRFTCTCDDIFKANLDKMKIYIYGIDPYK